MSKLFNYYSDNIDHTWYKSSNIVYSECVDNKDDFKTLTVVFTNGTQYRYDDVDVNDYLLFRENESQGKALNRLIKSNNYKYEKLDNADLEMLNEEYSQRSGGGIFIYNDVDNGFTIKNNIDEVIYHSNILSDNEMKLIRSIFDAIGIKYIIRTNEAQDTETNISNLD